REGRIAAADGRLTGEDAAEAAFAGERLELGARIGDGREPLRAPGRPLPEEVELAARLERGSRLGGNDEERALGVERLRRSAHRGGMRRVEYLEQLPLDGAPKNLRREAGHP